MNVVPPCARCEGPNHGELVYCPACETVDEFLAEDLRYYGVPRMRNALAKAGIATVGQLTELTEEEFLRIEGIGHKAMNLARVRLKERGLHFTPWHEKNN